MFRITIAVLIFSLTSPALADSTDDARHHYDKATAHFAVGEFAEAATEYQAAFKAKPDPALLYDAAQAYRLANNPEKALILYRNYLQLYPNQPNTTEVQAQIEKLREAIAAADKAKTAPPTGTTAPKRIEHESQQASHPEASSTTPALAGGSVSTASDHRAKKVPLYKRWWLWTAVGAVVAGGAVLAIVLSTKSSGSWSNEPDVGPGSRNGLTVTAVLW